MCPGGNTSIKHTTNIHTDYDNQSENVQKSSRAYLHTITELATRKHQASRQHIKSLAESKQSMQPTCNQHRAPRRYAKHVPYVHTQATHIRHTSNWHAQLCRTHAASLQHIHVTHIEHNSEIMQHAYNTHAAIALWFATQLYPPLSFKCRRRNLQTI